MSSRLRNVAALLAALLAGCDSEPRQLRFAVVALIATVLFVVVPLYRLVRSWWADRRPSDDDVERVLAAFRREFPSHRVHRLDAATVRVERGEAHVDVDILTFIQAASYGIDSASAAEEAMGVVRQLIAANANAEEQESAATAYEEAAAARPGVDAARQGEELLIDIEGRTLAIRFGALAASLWGLPRSEWVASAADFLSTFSELGAGGPLESDFLPCFLTPARARGLETQPVVVEIPGLPYPLAFLRSSGLTAGFVDAAQLAARGLDAQQVLEDARLGVRHLLPPREDIEGLITLHSVDEDAAAAILAVPAMLRGDDELAAVAPAHDTLLLWVADDWEAALEARARCEELGDEDGPIPEPVGITADGFEPLQWSDLDGSDVL